MSAERHALNAALEYSKLLEAKLELRDRERDNLRQDVRRLRIQLNAVRDASRQPGTFADDCGDQCNEKYSSPALPAFMQLRGGQDEIVGKAQIKAYQDESTRI